MLPLLSESLRNHERCDETTTDEFREERALEDLRFILSVIWRHQDRHLAVCPTSTNDFKHQKLHVFVRIDVPSFCFSKDDLAQVLSCIFPILFRLSIDSYRHVLTIPSCQGSRSDVPNSPVRNGTDSKFSNAIVSRKGRSFRNDNRSVLHRQKPVLSRTSRVQNVASHAKGFERKNKNESGGQVFRPHGQSRFQDETEERDPGYDPILVFFKIDPSRSESLVPRANVERTFLLRSARWIRDRKESTNHSFTLRSIRRPFQRVRGSVRKPSRVSLSEREIPFGYGPCQPFPPLRGRAREKGTGLVPTGALDPRGTSTVPWLGSLVEEGDILDLHGEHRLNGSP